MMKVGIDAIGFYTPHYFLDLITLAKARHIDHKKFYEGLGQKKMSIIPPNEDIITMGANAADHILTSNDINEIDTVMFATESGIDYSKSAGIYIHKLLKLSSNCRVIELKQACYSVTMALQIATSMILTNYTRKILIIASDIANYGFNTSGESSQGSGAIAMLITAQPRLLAIEPESGVYAEEAGDFWRPNYCETPIVNGKYSCELYLKVLEKVWKQYSKSSKRQFSDHKYYCYHVPIPKLVEKAHKCLIKLAAPKGYDLAQSLSNLNKSLYYNRIVGNCYTASLIIHLLSLLETFNEDLMGSRIGLYSYGSGFIGEYFSVIVQPKYKDALHLKHHKNLLENRKELSYGEYKEFYKFRTLLESKNCDIPQHKAGKFRLVAIKNHTRKYEKIK